MTELNKPENANAFIENQLGDYLKALEKTIEADVLSFIGPIASPVNDFIRDSLESIKSKEEKLAIILETEGGDIEIAERIAEAFRHHYKYVEFIIPNFAMSAGTVLVMSGDAIHMDYYSVLGPIDPQVLQFPMHGSPRNIRMIPALGYLKKFEELIEKSARGELTTAELTYLVQKFDPGELYNYEQAKELSITLLKEWLVKYKFKNWEKTKTRGLPVTGELKKERAEEIAKLLSETDKWHSHGRGISMDVLRNDVKLQIEDFAENADLNNKIKCYYKLLIDYMMRRGHSVIVHTNECYKSLFE